MTNIADRYTRLCRAYIQLAERFQKLDVEHMALKGKLLPLLKVLGSSKDTIAALKQEKANLEAELQSMTAKFETLSDLEALLKSEAQAQLLEAEDQMSLVEQTIQEMEAESDPDLDENDKHLLDDFLNSLGDFSFESNGATVSFNTPPINSTNPSSVAI